MNSECQAKFLDNVSYLKNDYEIYIFENMISLRNNTATALGGNSHPEKRAAIKEFSSASRRRLLRLFSMLRTGQLSAPLFITLTYHHSWEDPKFNPKHDLNLFLQFLRDNFTSLKYLWRMELQKRGAVHFHLFLWSFPEDNMCTDKRFINDLAIAWHRIADPGSSDHAQRGLFAEPLTSFRKAFAYISKYVAKEDPDEKEKLPGRRWGSSEDLPLTPIEDINIPKDVFFTLKRLARKLLKSQGRLRGNFKRIMQWRTSASFFCHHKQFIRLVNYAFDQYLASDIYWHEKDLFLETLSVIDTT